MDMDRGIGSLAHESRMESYRTTLCLAYQSFGVVYGDLSTLPIYVYKSIFSGSLSPFKDDDEIFGVLSLVFWNLTIIPLCKYIIFVLSADDSGEGGTFALYSLLCRCTKIGLLKNYSTDHEYVSCYDSGTSIKETRTSLLIKEFFKKYRVSRVVLLLIVLLATSMVISDGIVTPTMYVLSAVYGIQIKVPDLHENYTVIILACIILVTLFALQHHGTNKVGFLFAPIVLAWLISIGGVGIYNIFHWNPTVVRALSPYYIYDFFRNAGKAGWSSLGGVVLSITGAEAMFADLGHFSKPSIRLAFTAVVYPCLILAYTGEAAYLSKNKMELQSSFYKGIPEAVFWPIFIIATVVASQATISATFSIISQCRALCWFPRVKIIHTSNRIHGRIYIPEVNWMLMVLCKAVVIGFKDTNMIGNAYGGWFPIVASLVISSIMFTWHYGTAKKEAFELQNRLSINDIIRLGPNLGITRVPGMCLIYSDVPSGVPPMFGHFVANFPAFHNSLVFATHQSVMVPKVPASERFSVGRLGPPEFGLFWCIVRYGYKDIEDNYCFETRMIEGLVEFLRCEQKSKEVGLAQDDETGRRNRKKVQFQCSGPNEEAEKLLEAKEAGVAYMMGNTCVKARATSSCLKKFFIDIVYGFLRQNSRSPASELRLPYTSLIEVGMVYHI